MNPSSNISFVPEQNEVDIPKNTSIKIPTSINIKKTFHYPTGSLNKNFKKIKKGAVINICAYTITTTGYKPYIMFMLYNNIIDNKNILSLPKFNNKTGSVKENCFSKISRIMSNKIIINGYVEYGSEYYVLIDLGVNIYKLDHINKNDRWWFGLISEICNEKKILHIDIHNSVYNFFVNNKDYLYILDKDNNIIETPQSLYYGNHNQSINFISTFGILKADPLAGFGPFYYFATYELATKYSQWTWDNKPEELNGEYITDVNGRYIKGGIVRFVVFNGKMNLYLNRKNDIPDTSRLSLHRPKFMRKIIDTSGKWTKTFDTVFIGEIEVKPNIKIHIGGKYCLHNYSRQTPISYHFIDKNTVPDIYTHNMNIIID